MAVIKSKRLFLWKDFLIQQNQFFSWSCISWICCSISNMYLPTITLLQFGWQSVRLMNLWLNRRKEEASFVSISSKLFALIRCQLYFFLSIFFNVVKFFRARILWSWLYSQVLRLCPVRRMLIWRILSCFEISSCFLLRLDGYDLFHRHLFL